MLFTEAETSISVPSTEKCSLDKSHTHVRQVQHSDKNLAAISPSSSRSRFLQNTVASHSSRLSHVFSSSNLFRRLASETSILPSLAFHL